MSDLSPASYSALSGIPEARVYAALRSGELAGEKVGGRWQVSQEAFAALYEAKASELRGRARSAGERARAAGIRASWTAIFGCIGQGVGFSLQALIDNHLTLPVGSQPWLGIGIGAAASALLYAAKKYWWPDTVL